MQTRICITGMICEPPWEPKWLLKCCTRAVCHACNITKKAFIILYYIIVFVKLRVPLPSSLHSCTVFLPRWVFRSLQTKLLYNLRYHFSLDEIVDGVSLRTFVARSSRTKYKEAPKNNNHQEIIQLQIWDITHFPTYCIIN